MAVDFKSLLNRPATSFERPKPLPPGTYHGVVQGHEFGESAQKHTPYCRLTVKVISADESVPIDQLEGAKLPRDLRRDFYLTDDSMYRFREFLESCGIPLENRMLDEAIAEARRLNERTAT